MRIWVRKSASIQKRTSPLKFGNLAEKKSAPNLSKKVLRSLPLEAPGSGELVWGLVWKLCAVWVVTAGCLLQGIHSAGKAAYVTLRAGSSTLGGVAGTQARRHAGTQARRRAGGQAAGR